MKGNIKRNTRTLTYSYSEHRITLIFLTFIFLTSCITNKNNEGYSTFKFGKETREYIYYSPLDLKPNSPLVLVVHGYTDDAYNFMHYTKMNHLADSLGFAVCYPRGSKDNKGNRFWYVGYDFHQHEDIKNDCGYVEALTVFLQKKYKLNPIRTYITGMSNGGDLCVKLACQGTGVFKAFAPVVGCLMDNIHESSLFKPAPMLFINGTADSTTYYEGDMTNKGGWGVYWGIDEMIRYFSNQNGCNQLVTDTISDRVKTDNTMAIRYTYINEQSIENKIIFFKIVGGGHDWTGSSGSNSIDASKEIAKFFMNLPYANR